MDMLRLIVSFLTITVLAKEFSSSELGRYQLLILVPNLTYLIFNLGVNDSLVYLWGHGPDQRRKNFRALFFCNIILGFISSVLLSILFFFDFLSTGWNLSNGQKVLLVLSPIAIFTFYTCLFTLQSQEKFHHYNTVKFFNSFLIFIGLCLAMAMGWLRPIVGLYIYAGVHLIMGSVYLILFGDVLHLLKYKILPEKKDMMEVLKLGSKFYLDNVFNNLSARANYIMINYFVGASGVGIYSIAMSMAEKIWIIPQAVSNVLYPRLSHLATREEKKNLTLQTIKVMIFVSVLIFILGLILSAPFIDLAFGGEYNESLNVFMILLPGVCLFSSSFIVANYLKSRGRPEINSYISIAFFVFNILLNMSLIPSFGIVGGAMATAATYFLVAIVKILLFSKFEKVKVADMVLKRSELKKVFFLLKK